ncbi:C6 zinc finger domain protein [Emericellopsis atlantica]|uniref:C6 zinc finger domain protein n=1 Tax=Emericellopsis atlantica TaxID=2614577 RepID=A0A9P7ZLA3_9HYPO|nr:C6 zinc finger domain protein [Emericellopsis atlantica]KAG9254095.1 C6 zinc finger domain protein [Emericellopsis atlantica]
MQASTWSTADVPCPDYRLARTGYTSLSISLTLHRKRHVKCDETRPSCLNCMKWRGYCDAYAEDDAGPSKASGKLIHTKKAPLIVTEPVVNTICFTNDQQRAYFNEWSALSVTYLSGGLVQTRLWTATMPQLTLQEPTLRYAAMAIGALRHAYNEEGHSMASALTINNKHYMNAITYYCEALRLQSKARPTREGLRTAMLSSLLFICFETQRANMPVALKHITHGFSMLNELAACTEKAPDLVSIAPAPPSLVQEILDCYKPLELQSRSFMGSYQKFFFPPSQRQQQGGIPGGPPEAGRGTGSPSPAGETQAPADTASSQSASPAAVSSPASQPGTPWQSQTAPSQSDKTQQTTPHTGLPSPASQGSPQSQESGPSPPRPQRPPGILPFTKHSPYFRPKQSSIHSLEELPRVFSSADEAQGYWGLLQRQMVQYIPILSVTTSQLNLPQVQDEAELDMKLSSVRQNPRISRFVAESRYWLQRWIEAYDPLYHAAARNKERDLQAYLQAANLRIEYLILYIYTAIPRFSGLITAKGLTPQYREINTLAEMLLKARPNCGFAMDSGWTWPLFVSAFGCRDPSVRADAIRILGEYPIRNALRDSRVFRAIALKNQLAEEESASCGDDEQLQWLRLRRREVVFEDFGTNIVFRSAKREQETGRWVVVEEAANFTLQADGTLDWHVQPISSSTSILSGVC